MLLSSRTGSNTSLFNKRLSTMALAAAAGLAVSNSAHGQFIWDQGTSGAWAVPGNWNIGEPNGIGDNVLIRNPVSAATAISVTVGPNLTRTTSLLAIEDTGATDVHQLIVANNSTLQVADNVTNAGVILLMPNGNNTDFGILADITLDGGGTVRLNPQASAGASFISDNGGAGQNIITNVDNTIEGMGNIGQNGIGLVNETDGLINANVPGKILLLDPGTTHGFTNQGTYRASDGGFLQLTGSFGGAFDNTDGVIEATGAGSQVQLIGGVSVNGGTYSGLSGGTINVPSANTANVADVDFTAGTFIVENNATLNVSTAFTNNGVIDLNADANNVDFGIVGNVTLDGGGTLNLNKAGAGSAFISDNGSSGQDILTNVDNTIRGAGNIGQNSIGLINQAAGLINANLSGEVLLLDPGVTHGYVNQGTYRASDGGILQLTGSFGGGFENTGGTIEATGAGSEVQLIGNVNINSGTLSALSGATINVVTANTANLTDIDFTSGTLKLENNSTLNVTTALTNNGVIDLDADANSVDFGIVGNVTLDGGGIVNLNKAGAGFAIISDNGGSGQDILTNVNNTIRGAGNIGQNGMGVINQAAGLINANLSGQTLLLDPGSTHGFVNQGTYRASDGGILQLTGSFSGSFDNTGGTIEATGAGSEVQLIANVDITNGTLRSGSGASINVVTANTADVTDVDFTTGTLNVSNNATFQLTSTFTNSGTVNLDAAANNVDLGIVGDVTLDGGGTINLNQTGAGLALISDNGGSGVNRLTNVDNIIQGAGNIGQNGMTFTNGANGQIIANDAANGLLIDPANSGGNSAFINQGLISAQNNATLTLSGSFSGGFTNAAGGTIDIQAGSTLDLTGTLVNEQGADFSHDGTFNIQSGGNFINQSDAYSPGASPGIVNVASGGTFTNDTTGTVTLELNGDGTPGVDFDTIRGDGTFELAGTLDIDLNFTPNFYESIELILDTSSRNINGTFEQLGFDPIVAPGDALAVTYRANTFNQVDAVLLTRALPGDANLDGFISQADLDAVLLNWGSTTSTWSTGEMSGDDFVSQADLDLVLLNWGDGTPPDLSAIPEPTSLALAGLGGLLLMRRRSH